MPLNRPMRPEDLKDKGFPFGCRNCGNKPTPQQVVDYNGDCEVCGDTITTYSIDAAELIIALSKNNKE